MPLIKYVCEWCGEHESFNKRACEMHEAECHSNPLNRACRTCKFYRPPKTRRQTFDCVQVGKRVLVHPNCESWVAKGGAR